MSVIDFGVKSRKNFFFEDLMGQIGGEVVNGIFNNIFLVNMVKRVFYYSLIIE